MTEFYGEKTIKLLRGGSFFLLGKRILKCRSAPGCSISVTIRKIIVCDKSSSVQAHKDRSFGVLLRAFICSYTRVLCQTTNARGSEIFATYYILKWSMYVFLTSWIISVQCSSLCADRSTNFAVGILVTLPWVLLLSKSQTEEVTLPGRYLHFSLRQVGPL